MKNFKVGFAEYLLLFLVALAGIFLVGGVFLKNVTTIPSPLPVTTVTCCDSGDGDACKPSTEANKTLTFKGQKYGVIKTSTEFIEGNLHLKDSGEKFNGKPIIVNSSENHYAEAPAGSDPETVEFVRELNNACNRPDPVKTRKDLYFKKVPSDPYLFMKSAQPFSVVSQYCDSIPDDEIIFVCKENCKQQACSFPVTAADNISCYGSENTIYDVYYRISDLGSPGVPDFVKNCSKQVIKSQGITIVPKKNYPQKNSLQLETFGAAAGSINPGLSPFCKPAIYLYPDKEVNVNVKVNAVGLFTYTDPKYPAQGWNVRAYPDGTIISNGKKIPYLYYEADVPTSRVNKPEKGFVVEGNKVNSLLEEILPKLGLNDKESSEMSSYWKKALPQSPYYFVGVLPESTLNTLSLLDITPKPTTINRVSLYFEPLDNKETVEAPILTGKKRSGFTVIEWGGIIKTDKPFTCFQ